MSYPPTPATDGTEHAHNPERCGACRRQADMFFQGGVRAEQLAVQGRLSRAGLHDGKCPEPKRPCTCGIDDAIFARPASPRLAPAHPETPA